MGGWGGILSLLFQEPLKHYSHKVGAGVTVLCRLRREGGRPRAAAGAGCSSHWAAYLLLHQMLGSPHFFLLVVSTCFHFIFLSLLLILCVSSFARTRFAFPHAFTAEGLADEVACLLLPLFCFLSPVALAELNLFSWASRWPGGSVLVARACHAWRALWKAAAAAPSALAHTLSLEAVSLEDLEVLCLTVFT